MGDRGREGAGSLLQNLGRDRVRQCGWEGGDKRRQMTEPEPGAEKCGLGALQGAREAILGQVPVLLRVPWECRARQGLGGGLAGSWDSWILFPLGSSSQLLNLAQPVGDTPPHLCQACNFLPSAAGLGDPVAVCLSDVCVVRSG